MSKRWIIAVVVVGTGTLSLSNAPVVGAFRPRGYQETDHETGLVIVDRGNSRSRGGRDRQSSTISKLRADLERQKHDFFKLKKLHDFLLEENLRLRTICEKLRVDPEALTAHRIAPDQLSVGRIVYLDGEDYFKISQIIDSDNMLVYVYSISNANHKVHEFNEQVCLRGVHTLNLADRDLATYDKLLKVTGTTQYITVLKSKKTVKVLEPYQSESKQRFF